jgi:ATP-dependent protease ClpP protease subunit
MNKKEEINNFLTLDFTENNVSNQQETRIFGEIFEGSLELFDTFISNAKPEEKIEFFVNSGGGSVFDGVAMSSLIKRHKGETVGTAFLMIHNASIGFTFGEASQLRKDAAVLDKISNQISEIYVSQIAKNSKLINGSKEETRIHIQIAENETKVEPLTDKEIKNILNKYGNSAPKQFLNKFEMNKEENEQKQAIENGGFWDSLKALFKANPEKLKELEIENISDEEVKPEEEIDNQEDGEGMDEALAAEIDAAKSLLMANGFIVLTEDEAVEKRSNLKTISTR